MSEMPESPAEPQAKKGNRGLLIGILVFVVLCCCCIAIGGGVWLWNSGDAIVQSLGL